MHLKIFFSGPSRCCLCSEFVVGVFCPRINLYKTLLDVCTWTGRSRDEMVAEARWSSVSCVCVCVYTSQWSVSSGGRQWLMCVSVRAVWSASDCVPVTVWLYSHDRNDCAPVPVTVWLYTHSRDWSGTNVWPIAAVQSGRSIHTDCFAVQSDCTLCLSV